MAVSLQQELRWLWPTGRKIVTSPPCLVSRIRDHSHADWKKTAKALKRKDYNYTKQKGLKGNVDYHQFLLFSLKLAAADVRTSFFFYLQSILHLRITPLHTHTTMITCTVCTTERL